jgi:protein subunit release factor B
MEYSEINKIADNIINIHYADKPNSIKDSAYRQQKMKTLKAQIVEVLSEWQESTEHSEQHNSKALHIADVMRSYLNKLKKEKKQLLEEYSATNNENKKDVYSNKIVDKELVIRELERMIDLISNYT